MAVDLVVVGLGNPGPNYARTRHNAGARVLDELAARWSIPLQRRNPHALLGLGSVEGRQVVLARPRSYMNESGPAVAYLAARFGIRPERLLILYDEMDLPLGVLRVRPRGSAGGHQGMTSVLRSMSTQELPRLRVGIGRPPLGVHEIPYVLGAFTRQEEEELAPVLARAADAVACVLSEGVESAMNRFNAQPPEPGQDACASPPETGRDAP